MSPVTSTDLTERAVIFTLGEERYGVSVDRVREVQRIVAFSGAPSHSEAVIGMVNLRGAVVPVIDMRIVAGIPATEYTAETPMIICSTEDQLVALVVDQVEDVRDLPDARLKPLTKLHPLAQQVLGTCRCNHSLVYLLDVDALVAQVALCEAV